MGFFLYITMANAGLDDNRNPTIIAVSNVDNSTPVRLQANPSTHALITEATIALGGLNMPEYDYVSVAYPTSTTETYTFKTGGSGGTTVATIAIVYTTSTKDYISSVTKT